MLKSNVPIHIIAVDRKPKSEVIDPIASFEHVYIGNGKTVI